MQRRAFNYVGSRQEAWGYIVSSLPFFAAPLSGARRFWSWVSTAKCPRRGHSTIRVQNLFPFLKELHSSSERKQVPTHEITCGRIDAHSHLRALAVEALAQNAVGLSSPDSRFEVPSTLIPPGLVYAAWGFGSRVR